jgi:hypothetical protein
VTPRWPAALGLLVLLAGCSSPPSPPADASPPEVVLAAYLAALQAGDCATARTLATETFRVGSGELCGALRVTRVGEITEPARPRSGEVVYAISIRTVGGDVSMPDGDHTWFYDLQQQPNGAWRITGGGSGP